MTKPILSLQNIPCETLGNFEGLFLSDGFDIEKVDTRKRKIPKDPTQYSAIIILGGPMSVYDNSDFITDQINLTQTAGKKKIPLVGICLGSQIIARSSGGTVFKGPKKEIGWRKIMIESSGSEDLFSGFHNLRPTVFQWHGDTYSLPKAAKILARSDIYPQAFAIGSLIGIQFHLEVTEKMIQSWLRNYKSEVLSEKIDVQEMMKDSAAHINELEKYCSLVYSNFCTKFSL
jgi:GMP synthase-like glutamine amidotransferase